jgi:translation elongation factor EF-4
MSTGAAYKVEEVGHLFASPGAPKVLSAGEVGYFIAGIKTVG